MTGRLMRPMLLCRQGHTGEVPELRNAQDVSGPIHCGECGERMAMISYATIERDADFAGLSYDVRRATGTWWTK